MNDFVAEFVGGTGAVSQRDFHVDGRQQVEQNFFVADSADFVAENGGADIFFLADVFLDFVAVGEPWEFFIPAVFEAVEKVEELAVGDLNFNQRVELEFENNAVVSRNVEFFAKAQENILTFAVSRRTAAFGICNFLALKSGVNRSVQESREGRFKFLEQRLKNFVVVFAEPLNVAVVEFFNFAGEFVFQIGVGQTGGVKAGFAHWFQVERRKVRAGGVKLVEEQTACQRLDENFFTANFVGRVRENVLGGTPVVLAKFSEFAEAFRVAVNFANVIIALLPV